MVRVRHYLSHYPTPLPNPFHPQKSSPGPDYETAPSGHGKKYFRSGDVPLPLSPKKVFTKSQSVGMEGG